MKKLLAALLAALLLTGCQRPVPPQPQPTEPVTEPPQTTAPPTAETTQPSTAETTQPSTEATLPEPDTVSVLDFLQIATEPVGSTMYVWGGGWNEEDTGAGIEAVTLGISPQWALFAAQQDSSYDHDDTRYQIHDGLDCSGYVGWAVYNIMETENGNPGYVCSSTKMAQTLSQRGLGDYIPAEDMTQWLPGDIMSMKGHVWISAGMCDDGSVLLLHASPPGVIFSGTRLIDGSDSEAVALARQIMQTHYPDWYARYPDCARPHSYLTTSSAMRWSDEMLDDPEGLRTLTAPEVAQLLYPTP